MRTFTVPSKIGAEKCALYTAKCGISKILGGLDETVWGGLPMTNGDKTRSVEGKTE